MIIYNLTIQYYAKQESKVIHTDEVKAARINLEGIYNSAIGKYVNINLSIFYKKITD